MIASFRLSENDNLVSRIVSEPLFQSSSPMTTLAQGVVFLGVFETADIRFRMSNNLLFIAISPFRFLDGWYDILSYITKWNSETRGLSNQILKSILF